MIAMVAGVAAPSPSPPAAGESVSSTPPPPSLRTKYARGSLWALIGYGGQQVLRVVGQFLLWRLLFNEAFGLMSIVNVFTKCDPAFALLIQAFQPPSPQCISITRVMMSEIILDRTYLIILQIKFDPRIHRWSRQY